MAFSILILYETRETRVPSTLNFIVDGIILWCLSLGYLIFRYFATSVYSRLPLNLLKDNDDNAITKKIHVKLIITITTFVTRKCLFKFNNKDR